MRASSSPLVLLLCAALVPSSSFPASDSAPVRSGAAALGDDWQSDAPGVRRAIEPSDLPAPEKVGEPEESVASLAKVVKPKKGAMPKVPDGFAVEVFATGFKQPRTLRVAPNGDVFLSESGAGRVLVFRGGAAGKPGKPEVFAEKLEKPYGIVFHPPDDPTHVYVAAANQVVRYPYRATAKGPRKGEVIVADIPTERHWTRDLAVSRDGKQLFIAIGSSSNLGAGMPDMSSEDLKRHEETHGRGAAWGKEENRAVVRVFDPDGKELRNYATGLRNCSGLAMQPGTDNLWCVVNERDHLGPNLVPDFMARVQEGKFYGWPWYYIGDHEDPAAEPKRPDLAGQVQVPQVLFQAHSSALSVAFYDHDAFPAEYRGDAFVALHGSHSRPQRVGFKVVRVRMNDGQPTGEYDDFMTGFVVSNESVWGRPAGIAVTRDGALLVSDDANGTLFRVTRKPSR